MTVNETIEQLTAMQQKGYGSAVVRCYTELGGETYKPIELEIHTQKDSKYGYPSYLGDWVEVS